MMTLDAFLKQDVFGTGRSVKDVLASAVFVGGVFVLAERGGLRETVLGTASGMDAPIVKLAAYNTALVILGEELKEASGM